jgi:hypothetical protein
MTIFINSTSKGIRIYSVIVQVAIDAMNITKVTAAPILTALLSFLDTPKNGHSPRNFTRIKLLIKAIPTNSEISSVILFPSYPFE